MECLDAKVLAKLTVLLIYLLILGFPTALEKNLAMVKKTLRLAEAEKRKDST